MGRLASSLENTAAARIVGEIGDGGAVSLTREKGVREKEVGATPRIAPDDDASGVLLGLKVETDSLAPRYNRGDVLFYNDDAGDWQSHLGAECVVRMRGGPTVVRTMQSGPQKTSARLVGPNAADMIVEGIEWAAPIRWVRRAGSG